MNIKLLDTNRQIVLMGPQHVGKTSIGYELSKMLAIAFLDSDDILLKNFNHTLEASESLYPSIRALYASIGREQFHKWETASLIDLPQSFVLATGGGIASNLEGLKILSRYSPKILLVSHEDIVWERIIQNGIPAYLNTDMPIRHIEVQTEHSLVDAKGINTHTQSVSSYSGSIDDISPQEIEEAKRKFDIIFHERMQVYRDLTNVVIDTIGKSPEEIAQEVIREITNK